MHASPPTALRNWFCVLAALLMSAAVVTAQEGDDASARPDEVAAGHSAHGEAFNEGPRQAAYLMGGTGDVHLEVTTRNPQVQKLFDQGIGQLHGFWYFEAERSFRQAAALDPDCAMTYWGMAMANYNNAKRAKGFLEKAVENKSKVSRREQMWIDGLAAYQTSTKDRKSRWKGLVQSLEGLVLEYPDELEAKAFLAWALYMANRQGLPFNTYFSVDAIIGDVLDENPMHPVHHYRIHLWDYKKPELALKSAALCGQSAPRIAHMWHMPGHTYWRVKRYHDSAWQQEASARTDHASMVRDRVMPYQIHNYAHNNEWLTRSLSYIGRAHDAVSLAKNMIELPRHPAKNTVARRGSSSYYGRLRLFELLDRYEMWEETTELCNSVYLEPTDIEEQQVKRLQALGAAYLGLGDLEHGKGQIAELDQRLAKLTAERDEAIAAAERKAKEAGKPETDLNKAKTDAGKPFGSRITRLNGALDELNGRLAMAEGRHEEGIALLSKARGLLKEHLSLFYLQAGNKQKAEEVARSVKDSSPNQVYPLANYAYVLQACGKSAEAQAAFHELQTTAGMVDIDLRVFQRLAPLAAELNLGEDWRQPRETPDDVGVRPDLDTLGPFRWHPSPAPDWELPSAPGETVALKQYRGKPVLVIFYLGYGCLHCAEQLEKFAPMTGQFNDAGIELVAISSDSLEDLDKSRDNYRNETEEKLEFPFPLAADPELKVFKKYRAYDDFENVTLHGTFLIDSHGLVRWQDLSYDPFMEAEFLLEESKRLLAQEIATGTHHVRSAAGR